MDPRYSEYMNDETIDIDWGDFMPEDTPSTGGGNTDNTGFMPENGDSNGDKDNTIVTVSEDTGRTPITTSKPPVTIEEPISTQPPILSSPKKQYRCQSCQCIFKAQPRCLTPKEVDTLKTSENVLDIFHEINDFLGQPLGDDPRLTFTNVKLPTAGPNESGASKMTIASGVVAAVALANMLI